MHFDTEKLAALPNRLPHAAEWADHARERAGDALQSMRDGSLELGQRALDATRVATDRVRERPVAALVTTAVVLAGIAGLVTLWRATRDMRATPWR